MSLPNKRKRTLSQTSHDSAENEQVVPHQEEPPKKSEDLYLEDGNIVLVAGNVAFRVHRSQMARHSEVFRDMLALSFQPSNSEMFDGRPVVRLSDSAGDILELLRALYDNTQFHAGNQECLISIIRLSTKYLMDPIRTSALRALSKVYPDTLKEWDSHKGLRDLPEDVIQLINADLLVPSAYYELCDYGMEDIIDCNPPYQVWPTYLRGKDTMATILANFVNKHIVGCKPEDGCNQPRTCRMSTEAKAHSMLRSTDWILGPNPLLGLGQLSNTQNLTSACAKCREALRTIIQEERERVWKSLPKVFGVGDSWEELRKKK